MQSAASPVSNVFLVCCLSVFLFSVWFLGLFRAVRTFFRGPRMSTTQLWQVRLQRFSLEDRDPLNCFNEHVKGPLRAMVESQIGNELRVPFHIALIACLPMIFYASVNVLACDNGPCETSAVLSGYSSVTQYMVTQVVAWTLTIFLSFPVTSPILLRMINFVVSRGNGPLELFMALLCCPLAYIWSYICGSLIWGSIAALVQILGSVSFQSHVWRIPQ